MQSGWHWHWQNLTGSDEHQNIRNAANNKIDIDVVREKKGKCWTSWKVEERRLPLDKTSCVSDALWSTLSWLTFTGHKYIQTVLNTTFIWINTIYLESEQPRDDKIPNKAFPQNVHCLHNGIGNIIFWQWRWELWNHSKNCESIANIENCETHSFLKTKTNMALRQWSSEIYTAEFRELQASTFCCSRDGRLGLLAGFTFNSHFAFCQVHILFPLLSLID